MALILPIIVAFIMLLADQLTKIGIIKLFENNAEPISIIDGVISLYHVNNDGAGFSIFSGKTTFLIILTAVFMIVVLYLLIFRKYKSALTDWGFCLILSGGVGNFIDRIFRNGAVVDFIKTDFISFPIFNVADICITVGAGLLILYFILDMINEQKNKKGQEKNEEN